MAKFRTRARAVDMLGRQQIAGVPNAISELFKNAHDAYADHAVVDYFHSDRLFVLRDDGLGMTRNDFEERWLTIGTESKVGSLRGVPKPPPDPTKQPRPITGEKGIGRLAIAVVGNQVLVLTRAKTDGRLHDLVAAYLHWGLFAIPGVNLDEIEIPIFTFPGGTIPSLRDVEEMVDVVRSNVNSLQGIGYLDDAQAADLLQDIDNFKVDPQEVGPLLKTPSLLGSGHGTHFYIKPARHELGEDLNQFNDSNNESRLRKLLIGFSNTMVPNHSQPSITTSVFNWPTDDTQPTNLIAESEFFTTEEFNAADHRIQGRFDEFGQFTGTISVYGQEFTNHVVPWAKGQGKTTSCGPFALNVAYVPGVFRQSRLPPEEWKRLSAKVESLGGLYVYKDGIRVLPYGDNAVDFLNLETRRSKSASYYFFSYRRMFGTLELTQERNQGLTEKAGREGFQDNRAFRDFREILENFFIVVAGDFFRIGGENSQVFEETRIELQRLKLAREQQDRESRRKRAQFERQLDTFFERTNSGIPAQECESIIRTLLQDVDAAAQQRDEIALLNAEINATKGLNLLRRKYRVDRPSGTGLTTQLRRDWNAYAAEVELLEREQFSSTQSQIQAIVTKANHELKFALNETQRVDLLINEILLDSKSTIEGDIQAANSAFADLGKRIADLTRAISVEVDQGLNDARREIRDFDFSASDEDEIDNFTQEWGARIEDQSRKHRELLQHVQAQIESINWYRDENGFLIGNAEILAALEDEVLALRDRVDADVELAQIGMALNIINHEYTHAIEEIREGLRRLRSWATENSRLMPIYRQVTDNFTHLDSYLTMFTPLNRRLYRTAVDISGQSINEYLQKLFRSQLQENDISLTATKQFTNAIIHGYPSTYYPVFVNLVDNAIFWLMNQPSPRAIHLDYQNESFLVTDNGSGIPKRDRSSIFELGFSRKPGGRGMGLYISQEVLKKEGYKLELDDNYHERGTRFMIGPIK